MSIISVLGRTGYSSFVLPCQENLLRIHRGERATRGNRFGIVDRSGYRGREAALAGSGRRPELQRARRFTRRDVSFSSKDPISMRLVLRRGVSGHIETTMRYLYYRFSGT